MNWERVGASSGLLAAVLYGVAFIVFLGQDPTGDPRIPDLANATPGALAYINDHQELIQVQLLLASIATVVFLWFLGSLWAHLRAAEGGPARVSAIASAGGIVGATAVLAGLVVYAAAAVNPGEDVGVGALYTLSVMSIGLGAAAFTVFFLAVARVILDTGALHWLIGALAVVAALASALGFVAIFADTGPFNAATGAFGYWVRFAAFVIWLAVASVALTASVGGRTTRRRR